uniref:Carboxypeptidase n=1 Tax=Acrobeloides nanus TaxID=290746 RepID=A0A914C171_9BILA
MGDQWFIENLAYQYAMIPTNARTFWTFTLPDENITFNPRIAGYVKSFSYQNQVTFDQVTVKGGGHFVPLDRPGPALQMIYNFIYQRSYNATLSPDLVVPLPLLSNATDAPVAPPSPKELAKVYDLPGLTFIPSFNHYSGYLNGNVSGNYLHYWLVESQGDPTKDPLVLWLQGGPGCSAIGGFFTEHGPFHPNPDGTTLFENIYAWNKAANILYLESPRAVGWSFQDTTINNDTTWDDDKSANDVAWAMIQFFEQYSEYQGREFYIAGESYGGVFVPSTTALFIKLLDTGIMNSSIINLRGMSVGNGFISMKWDINSLADYMYAHGLYGKSEWDALRKCCLPQNTTYCDLTSYLYPDGTSKGSVCGDLTQFMTEYRQWMSGYDPYNIYQDCYGYTTSSFGGAEDKLHHMKKHVEENARHYAKGGYTAAFVDQFARMNYGSTDSNGGFQCYMTNAATSYLNQAYVRDALHIPDYVQNWTFCSNEVGSNYNSIYNADVNVDMTPVFEEIIDSYYVQNVLKAPFRIIIYNGDADLACGMMQAEYFVENFISENPVSHVVQNRTEWFYKIPGASGQAEATAGFVKQFNLGGRVTLDLLTVSGSGHFVPTDRPGPALQLFYNYIKNKANYSSPAPFTLATVPKTTITPIPITSSTTTQSPQSNGSTTTKEGSPNPSASTSPHTPPPTLSTTAKQTESSKTTATIVSSSHSPVPPSTSSQTQPTPSSNPNASTSPHTSPSTLSSTAIVSSSHSPVPSSTSSQTQPTSSSNPSTTTSPHTPPTLSTTAKQTESSKTTATIVSSSHSPVTSNTSNQTQPTPSSNSSASTSPHTPLTLSTTATVSSSHSNVTSNTSSQTQPPPNPTKTGTTISISLSLLITNLMFLLIQ